MFFTKKGKVTIVLAFALLFSIVSPGFNPDTTSAAQKKTFGMVAAQTNFLDNYWPIIHRICEKSITKKGLGDSDYLLAAQVDLESGHLTSALSRDKNNCLGIDAYSTESESAYAHARWFDSLKKCFVYHKDLMLRGYKTAAKYHDNPYVFVSLIAASYAPGSEHYIDDIRALVDKYALYNAQYYITKIQEIEALINRTKGILTKTKSRSLKCIRTMFEGKDLAETYSRQTLLKRPASAGISVGFNSPIDSKSINFGKAIANLKRNIRSWQKDLKHARKDAYTTFHTLALAINYGRIAATKDNLGDAYDYVLAEYAKLNGEGQV